VNLSFIDFLNSAKIFACAYGLQQVEGFPQLVPFLALAGENQAGLEQAFKVFAAWGCESDGDVVDIHVLLRSDGTYQVWVWPEIERTLYRIVPETNLYRANLFNMAWIKKLETTNPAIHDLRRYCDLPISPVLLHSRCRDQVNSASDTRAFFGSTRHAREPSPHVEEQIYDGFLGEAEKLNTSE
jgi:hypothetical protein